MPIASNPNTGQTVYLGDDGAWKPAQTAVNPQTKEMLAFDGKAWSPVPQSKGVMNYIDDAVRSIANGVTLGWADKLAAKGNELVGQGNYDTNLQAERARDAQISPAISIPGEIAGAMALPVGAAARGATMGAKMLRGAGVGGVIGAISGAGAGDGVVDSAGKAAIGGVAGAGIGAVAPPAVEGIIQGGRALAQPVINAVRGAINPADEASRRVVTALQRDAAIDPQAANRLTPSEFAQNVSSGGPATIMDMGGETTRGLARSAANTSPEGRQLLTNATNDRYEGQSGRITQWLQGAFNYPDAHAQQQALDQVQKTVNRGAYAKAYREGDKPLWSPELERLTSSPAVEDALKGAATSGKDRAVVQGFGGVNPPINVTQDGRVVFNKGPNGVPTYPNLQFWDSARRNLSDAASAAQRAGRNEEASRLGSLSSSLNAELDRIVPSYQNARQGAASFFGAENALEAGQNFVSKNFAIPETRAALAKMSPQERQLFQDGFVSRYIDTLNQTGDRRNVLNQIASSPAAREKLNVALGPQKATELEARLRVEGIMDMARGAVQGNSTTARQLAELGFAGGAAGLGSVGAYNMDPKEIGASAIAAALIAGKHGIDSRVAQQVAKMLVSNEPQLVTRGLNLVSRNSRFMDALRSTDSRIAAGGGQSVPKVGFAGQLPATSAAGDQPNVPGPPGQ